MLFDFVSLFISLLQVFGVFFDALTGDSDSFSFTQSFKIFEEISEVLHEFSESHSNKDPNFKLVYNSYLEVLRTNTFYGTWQIKNSNFHKNDQEFIHPNEKGGFVVLNSISAHNDLLLFKNKYIDQEHIAVNNLISFLKPQQFSDLHKTFLANGISFQYSIEDGSDSKNSSKHTCTIKKFTLEIMHQDIEAYSIHLEKGFLDLRIKMKIEGSECFPDIETSEMKPYDERVPAEKENYMKLYKTWIVLHVLFGVWKMFRIRGRRACDTIQVIQVFLGLSISFYISKWHDLFVKAIRDEVWVFMGGMNVLALLPGLFIIMKSMKRTTFFWRFGTNVLILIGLQIAFNYSRKMLLAAFILIPCMDILRNLIPKIRSGYDLFTYVGILLPNLLIFEYFTFYEGNFARLAPYPGLQVFSIPLFILLFILLPSQVFIRKIQFAIKRSKKYLSPWSLQPEDSCPICMRAFQESYEDGKVPLTSITGMKEFFFNKIASRFYCPNSSHNSAQREQTVPHSKTLLKIIKTPCGHIFHEQCLDKWLRTKTQCPYCRESIKGLSKH